MKVTLQDFSRLVSITTTRGIHTSAVRPSAKVSVISQNFIPVINQSRGILSSCRRHFCLTCLTHNKPSDDKQSTKRVDEILTAINTMSESQRASVMNALQAQQDKSKAPHSVHKSNVSETEQGDEEPKVPFPALMVLGCMSAIPFIGFGFLDNALMLLAGDFIDHTVSIYLHTSVMASAAMGNVVSGAVGMQVHGIIDRMTQKLFLLPNGKDKADPDAGSSSSTNENGTTKPSVFDLSTLTPEQMNSRSAFLAGHIGGTIGIIIGLCLGMAPLLFLSPPQKIKAE